ncbi:MAG: DUF2231 domain-containing protein [Methylococcales bacterium]
MFDTYNFLSFQVHGAAGPGHKASDGVAGAVEQLLTFLESLIGLSPADMFSAIMPGVSSMANVHPLIVHFPIAFLFTFLIMDLLGTLFQKEKWRELATGLLYLGTLAAGLAVLAGWQAEDTVEHGENVHLLIERHEFFGLTVLSLAVVLSIWRLASKGVIKGSANIVFILLAIVLNFAMILGADLGGTMVYKYGVAVEAVKLTSLDYFKEHTHSH